MKIVIDDIPPSNNKFMGNSHSFREYATIKKQWEWMIRAKCKNKPKDPYNKANVTITYYFKNRRRHDPDNYSGKFILDGLVKSGILKDDSFDNIDLSLKGNYDKANPRTEVEISELLG